MRRDLPHIDELRQGLKEQPEANLVPVYRRLMSDQITPVLAYRRLVQRDDRLAPSFLFESVVEGNVGRYSFVGAQPVAEVICHEYRVTLKDHLTPANSRAYRSDDPLGEMQRHTARDVLLQVPGLPDFTGGWVGYVGYDTVRYLEAEKLTDAPHDDRNLPDIHMQLYRDVIAFDLTRKLVIVITHVKLDEHADLDAAYAAGQSRLDDLVNRIETPKAGAGVGSARGQELPVGEFDLDAAPSAPIKSNMPDGGYAAAVEKCKQYIAAGDIFQVVPSQRFERTTAADPFDIYRTLRVVNPSPYMFYLQADGAILVGSSPEILVRVQDGVITNRPLAGTRKRGVTDAQDRALEEDLLADPKERAEHVMLVDLGRNDVGRISEPGSIELPELMKVERYSHVMHISSTVTGRLAAGCSAWEALRHTLPVGTVSGAPKVRAMQIIDEMETTRRGPYAGAVGYADFNGNMDMAIALRTMVIQPAVKRGEWVVHLQAGAGVVADSDPESEHQETVNKAAALAKAIDLAEQAFGAHGTDRTPPGKPHRPWLSR